MQLQAILNIYQHFYVSNYKLNFLFLSFSNNRHYNPTHQQAPQHHPQQPSQPAQQQYWPNYYYPDPSQNSTDSKFIMDEI